MKKIGMAFSILSLLLLFTMPVYASSNKEEKSAAPEAPAESGASQGTQTEDSASSILEKRRDELEEEKKAELEAAEKPQGGILQGNVFDERGNPISGAEVTCIDESGRVAARTMTDEEGKYEFRDLAQGHYTIETRYSGFSSPVAIKFEQKLKRPPIPTGLTVSEIDQPVYQERTVIRAQWDSMSNVTAYRGELYLRGERSPLVQYPDMKQNYCEFGNLKEDTEYQVRIYSKNSSGYSSSYAIGLIRTEDKNPPSPWGLGVTSAINNRLDILWHGVSAGDLKGYILQIRRGKGRYLYYSKEGLTPDRESASIIEGDSNGLITCRIDERLEDGAPLLENGIPYSFRIMSIDAKGNMSYPSNPVEEIVLEDTVPPYSPFNIQYKFVGEDRLLISWETRDRDIAKYRIYYGVNKDRWDGVIYTSKNSHELVVNKDQLKDHELYIAVTAIDRAGNESGYRPVDSSVSVSGSGPVIKDIVLSSDNMYRDLSIAVREPPKKVIKKKKVVKKPPPPKPTRYGLTYLKEKGYTIEKGETATLKGKILFQKNTIVRVYSGGTLIIEDAELTARGGIWGGIRFLEGSDGYIRNTVVSDAAIGIAVVDNLNSLSFHNITVKECEENGIYVKDSTLKLTMLTITNNKTGLFILNSTVTVKNAVFDHNDKGILANNYNLNVEDSQFRYNNSYGIRLYGGGTIKHCVFQYNLVGAVLEDGRGSGIIKESIIESNRMDGIVLSAPSAEISKNSISNNGRYGIYIKDNANPNITENDIVNNKKYAVIGGGKIRRCFVAYNNGSIYIDDTVEKGKPDNVFSSSSSGVMKQILGVDYISGLVYRSILQ